MSIRLKLLAFIGLIVYLQACKKNNDAPVALNLADSLNVVNATTDTINFYLNGTRLNSNSNLYPAGSSGYYYVPTGQQVYQIKRIFNPTTDVVQTLINLPVQLDAHHYYSLFIAGETASQTFKTIDTLRADTAGGTCLVRFVNASPDAGNLDIAIGSASKFTSQGFGDASGFRLADTSSMAPVVLYQSGSSTPIATGVVPLLQGKSYTFFSRGKLNGTGASAINIGVTVNFN
jgi:hypothetical protein